MACLPRAVKGLLVVRRLSRPAVCGPGAGRGRGAYCGRVVFFAFNGAGRYFGTPDLAPGVRVHFDPGKLFAARERNTGRPADRHLVGDEGLVVHEIATDVIVWPSSLWRVDGLERPVRLLPGNRWVRCQAFTVLERVPAWLVAGRHGDAVEWVITRARDLTSGQVGALAALSEDGEEQLTRRLWDRWLRDHRGGSPVACGLSTLYQAVEEAARRAGPELFGWEERDEAEVLRDPGWLRARRAAYGAVLALGAPELLPAEQNVVLTRRWTSVFGSPGLPRR
jgi:hypothetical protein